MNMMLQQFAPVMHPVVRPLTILVTVAILWVTTSGSVCAAPNAQDEAIAQTLLVHFDAETTPEMRGALVAQMDGELVTWMHQIDVAEIRVPVLAGEHLQDGTMTASSSSIALATISNMPGANEIVTFAEADLVVSGMTVPNDPSFSDEMMSYGLNHVQAMEAWDVTTGSREITIAVVDSGVNADHPEFAGRLVSGYDFIHLDDQPDDDQGHGTHIAGIIGAALNNGQGVAGVCPNCRIMPVKVLNENNMGSWSQLAQGILFAVDHGAQVINLSLGASVPSETLAAAIEYAVERGVVVVAAAGNFGSTEPYYPAALEGVIAVGATDQAGTRWSKSNFGPYIDLTAPGAMIYSTYHDLNNLYHGYTYMSGTSMAAPFVSGVAALLLSVEPDLSAEQIIEVMILGAEDLGTAGWDGEYGHGRVDALGALMSSVPELATDMDDDLDDDTDEVGSPTDPSRGDSAGDVLTFLPVLSNN